MAEALVFFVKNQLVDKEEFAPLLRILRCIQPLLENAELSQVSRTDVRAWLHKLKNEVYNLEDVLDDVASVKVSFSMLSSCFCFSQLSPKRRVSLSPPPRDIAGKMDGLTSRLTLIYDEGRRLCADPTYYDPSSAINHHSIKIEDPELELAHFHDASAIIGRDEEKNIVIGKLLCESSEGEGGGWPDVIHIVGMGGMGKTTLAQLAYDDQRVKENFDMRIWVCVSYSFDVGRIAKEIIGAILGDSTQSVVEPKDLLEHIQMSIAGKKFLLALDDVWNEDVSKWQLLKQPFHYGSEGSKILVTTRNEVVATTMETNAMITLRTLSEEDCWLLFSQIAFRGRYASECKQLEQIGKGIARKCHGLPFAAKTLGSLMRFKRTKKQWEHVLHNETWNSLRRDDKNMFAPLLFSYYDMYPALKCCFTYCAIFPKDYVIDRDDVIKLWMSQGYLCSNRQTEEEMGQRCFMDLARLAFFQDFEKDYKGSIVRCKMHDLVHDLAQFLTNWECFIIEVDGVRDITGSLGEEARHSTLVLASGAAFPISIPSGKSLRALSILGPSNTAINPDIFLHLKCLRTLNLSGCWFKELTAKVNEFIHLRYLNLSGNYELERLPVTLCELSNLQTLLINDCMRLRRLPEAMEKLVSLRHLHIDWSFNLERLPKGIAKLTSLQTLDMLVVPHSDKNEAFQLGDLKKLNKLEGYLRICRCGNLENMGEAEKAELMKRTNIIDLNLDFDWSRERRVKDEMILEALRPHQTLKSLEIRKYRGITLCSDWMMRLTNLRRLVLYSCQYSESLPALGKLPSLESLEICLMKSVKTVGYEFLGVENAEKSSFISFPKLRELRFSLLGKWKVWEGSVVSKEEDISFTIMPCLRSLEIDSCFCIHVLPNFLKMTPLQNLTITECKVLQEHCQKGTGKEWDKISHIPNIKINYEGIQRH